MNYSNRGLFPFVLGGALGYGIGAYGRPNYQFYPMYYPPVYYQPYPIYNYPYYRR